MITPLTLITPEGKPLVFDNPVPVGEVIPAGTAHVKVTDDGFEYYAPDMAEFPVDSDTWFTARPPVAPESFADGDVAWVRVERDGDAEWVGPDGEVWLLGSDNDRLSRWLDEGHAYLVRPPRPESLADVLDDLGLTDEQRARVEKAVGA